MTVELPSTVERDLHQLATSQQRSINELVEDAIRQYLQAAAITDLDTAAVAEAQLALASELTGIAPWKDGGE